MNLSYMKKTAIFILLLISAFLFIGCTDSNCNVETVGTKGSPRIDTSGNSTEITLNGDESAELKYSARDMPPGSFCSVNFKIEVPDKCTASVSGSENDLNRKSVSAEIGQSGTYSRIVKADPDGNCNFSISLNSDGNTGGRFVIKNAVIREAAEDTQYSVYKSTSDRISMIFCAEDIKESGISDDDIVKWLNALDDIRETASSFATTELDKVMICAAEEFDHYGLAGEPVYICRSRVKDDLKNVKETIDLPKEKQNIAWGIVHEICHTADGFGKGELAARVFDTEFSAQFECAYCMTVNGYRYKGEQSALEYFSSSVPLENRVYSDEGFLYAILRSLNEEGKDLKCLDLTLDNDQYMELTGDSEKLEKFLDNISYDAGFDVRERFSETELEIVRAKYSG